MGWANIDDLFPEHRKVLAAGGDAAWLYVCGLCFVNRTLTGGVVPKHVVPRLSDRKNHEKLARRLVDVGLWEDRGDAYVIHDWSDWNEPAEAAKSRKEKARKAAQARWRKEGRASGRDAQSTEPAVLGALPQASDEQCSEDDPSSATSNAGSSVPAPPRAHPPLHSNTHKSSSSDQGVGTAVAEEEDSSLRSERPPTTATATAVDALAVAVLVAETRMRRRSEPPTSPGRWRSTVADDVLTEHGDRIRSLLAEGHDPATVAAKIDPPAMNRSPVVERRECCGTSVTVAHRIGCAVADEPTWDLDEAGVAVRR